MDSHLARPLSLAAPDRPGEAPPDVITALLRDYRAGDPAVLDQLYPLVYEHLRAVAHAQLRRDGRGRVGRHTLSTTALVHEAYFKLAPPVGAPFVVRDRTHFLAIAARAMRQVLIESARRHRAARRGGGVAPLDLDAESITVEERADALVGLDEALTRLATFAERAARVVELRFFGGLSEEEAAAVLGVTDRTVRRDWVKARSWLHAELAESGAPS